MTAEQQHQPPVHRIRAGAVQASVWNNTSDALKTENFTVSFSRRFRQGEEWKESKSFHRNDLPTLAKVANDAHTWIQEQEKGTTATKPEAAPRSKARPARKAAAGTEEIRLQQ